MDKSTKKSNSTFHYGWVIAFVGFIVFWFVICIVSNCVGMFVKPVCESLGISRSQFSLTTTFVSVASMILSLFVGKLYKRFGIKKVMLISSIVLPSAYACYSIAPNIYVFYVIAFITGFCMCATSSIGVTSLISNWFVEKRGLAIAIAATGSGIGGIFMNPIIGKLITNFGWRQTYLILAISMAVALIPSIAFLVKDKPSDMGLQPYGAKDNDGVASAVVRGMTVQEARKSPMFWMWVPVSVIVSVCCTCVMQHTVSYVSDIGYEYTFAATIASVITASLAVGKIVMGSIFDALGSKKASTLSLFLFFLALTLYRFADKVVVLYVAAAIIGFGLSFSTVGYSVVTQDVFGKKDFSSIYGNVIIFSSLGGALGSPTVAAVFDKTGSYKPAWLTLSILLLACVILVNMMFTYKAKHTTE